ncbi:hypothetical protein BPAE_0291g00040 [Botrytis paeoniae]|uniref:Uncharacterized protein n=1 Tax=Botrytis paeoniae TaxID=278948 RepID=A0A4Z1F7F9_9HELO|nr:hypothetical protein BPAE_0291g00040 [Botrytis paeoniae]
MSWNIWGNFMFEICSSLFNTWWRISHYVAGVSVADSYKHEEQNWSLAKEDLLKSNWFEPSTQKEMMRLREETIEEQGEELKEMSGMMNELEVLRESLVVSNEKFKEKTDECMSTMDPMLGLLGLVESSDSDDEVVE